MTAFWVGRVPFVAAAPLKGQPRVACALCQQCVAPEKAAAHAQRRHKLMASGVLAGQLGLPCTDTPDVPR